MVMMITDAVNTKTSVAKFWRARTRITIPAPGLDVTFEPGELVAWYKYSKNTPHAIAVPIGHGHREYIPVELLELVKVITTTTVKTQVVPVD